MPGTTITEIQKQQGNTGGQRAEVVKKSEAPAPGGVKGGGGKTCSA